MPKQLAGPGSRPHLTKVAKRSKEVLRYLQAYARFSITLSDETGWIALKMSCDRKDAEKMIAAARRGGASQ